MPTISKAWYARELAYAAHIIMGNLTLWMCVKERGDYVMFRATLEQIVKKSNEGFEVYVYGANPDLDLNAMDDNKFMDHLDEYDPDTDMSVGVVWLGDILPNGTVLCGALLTLLIEFTKKGITDEKN